MQFNIHPTDKTIIPALQDKIDCLNKPKGSLGTLESLALQIGLIQHTLTPALHHPCHILFGADHGIEREGVSFSPREVTWQQLKNYGKGGGGINVFCNQHGFKLSVVDVGTDYDFDLSLEKHIIDRKIAHGTGNFLYEPAMTQDQYEQALGIGAEQVELCHNGGCNIISFGEMGIGNTSPSSVWMHLFTGIPLTKCVGAGSGLPDEGIKHKLDVLTRSVENFTNKTGISSANFASDAQHETSNAELCIRYFGGFEMVAAIGGMLKAAEKGMVILVDGFIMTACILAASKLYPTVLDYAVFGHCGDEGGHKLMLDAMGAAPLLHLKLRLGEGTGAVIAYPIVQSAICMINEMDNFHHANITKYF